MMQHTSFAVSQLDAYKLIKSRICECNLRLQILPPFVQTTLVWLCSPIILLTGLFIMAIRLALVLLLSIGYEFESLLQLTVIIPTYCLYSEIVTITEMSLDGDTSDFRVSATLAILRSIGYTGVLIRTVNFNRHGTTEHIVERPRTELRDQAESLSVLESRVEALPSEDHCIGWVMRSIVTVKRLVWIRCSCEEISLGHRPRALQAVSLSGVGRLVNGVPNASYGRYPIPGFTWDGLAFHTAVQGVSILLRMSCVIFGKLFGKRICQRRQETESLLRSIATTQDPDNTNRLTDVVVQSDGMDAGGSTATQLHTCLNSEAAASVEAARLCVAGGDS